MVPPGGFSSFIPPPGPSLTPRGHRAGLDANIHTYSVRQGQLLLLGVGVDEHAKECFACSAAFLLVVLPLCLCEQAFPWDEVLWVPCMTATAASCGKLQVLCANSPRRHLYFVHQQAMQRLI